MPKTLAELKAENARLENEAVVEPEQEKPETVEPEQEETIDQNPEPSEKTGEESVEAWMADESDEQASSGGKYSDSDMAGLRRKLKAKLDQKDHELEQLKAKLEQIERKTVAPVQQTGSIPTLEMFNYDEAQYQAAMQQWLLSQVQNVAQSNEAKAKEQRQREMLDRQVNDHYERAAKLVQQSQIDPDLYQQADRTLRMSMESAFPGMGDVVTDQFLARLGEGSEKVAYHLGRNAQKRELLKAKLMEDPSGLTASIYLGRLLGEITQPVQKQTRAPAPAARAEGGQGTSDAESLKRKYQRAGDDVATRIRVKREAKAAGIDVSNW